jgi:Nif-specific regulatory protein
LQSVFDLDYFGVNELAAGQRCRPLHALDTVLSIFTFLVARLELLSGRNENYISMIAYLIVRVGNEWGDVYRLTPGQVMTIGRAPTNRLVLHDEICSRNHCELFQSDNQWLLRDLGSRNGTAVDGTPVVGDVALESGQVIQLGISELAFTLDLTQPLPLIVNAAPLESDTGAGAPPRAFAPGPEILHRQRQTRFEQENRTETSPRDRTSQELSKLYRLALEMGSATDSKRLAELILEGLFGSTPADIGAILVLPPDAPADVDPDKLTVLAYKAGNESSYERVSAYLSRVVLSDQEAILARDIMGDNRLRNRESLGELQVQSVICAPLRMGNVILGLVHLYSTNLDKPLGPEDLEFTLAVADQCAVALDRLLRQEMLADGLARVEGENQTLREQLGIESELVGSSLFINQLNHKIGRIAPTDATVLVRGESGVGKELVSRAIHFSSRRRNGPFVCMNCAALSESLLESELFGHEKGSFTGATGRKLGKFEQAHHGTLMLDEVGEMSLAIQAKFLRVLEGHPYERVGGGTPVNVDVRVVAATNRNLESAVEAGTFRRDLYFRLNVVEIYVMPLREHPADIPLLANFFLERFVRKTGRPLKGFTPAALDYLTNYEWPGNVRELQNAVERAVILCGDEYVGPRDIQLSRLGMGEQSRGEPASGQTFRELTLDSLEQEHILATLEWTKGNKSQAAQILGIERSTLDRKLKRYQAARASE